MTKLRVRVKIRALFLNIGYIFHVNLDYNGIISNFV